MKLLKIPAKLCELKRVRDFITDTYSEVSINEEKGLMLEIAVNEAVTNVIKHAYKNINNGSLSISVQEKEDLLEVRIIDRGDPFDPSAIDQPSFDGVKENGYGVYIIKRCVDNLTYSTLEGVNITKLEISFTKGDI